jgi:Tol biopolymer transport system component
MSSLSRSINSKLAMLTATSSVLLANLSGCYLDTSSQLNALSQVEHANVAFDVSPDGEQIVFASANGDVYQLDLISLKVSQLTKTSAFESTPAYSSDGKMITYAASDEGLQSSHIFTTKLDGTKSKQLTRDTQVFDRLPVYSPNDSQIAFARSHNHRPYSLGGWTWDDWDIYVMNADGSNVNRLTHNNYYGISGVVFSPGGKSILFSADNNRSASDLSTNVFEIPVDGSDSPKAGVPQPTSKGKYAAWASEPDFSPDGKTIVVISDRKSSYQYDLMLIDVDSANTKTLNATTVSRYNQHPVFAHDGERVLFLAGTDWNAGSRPIFSLWSINVGGTNAREIADSQLFTDPVRWQASN